MNEKVEYKKDEEEQFGSHKDKQNKVNDNTIPHIKREKNVNLKQKQESSMEVYSA